MNQESKSERFDRVFADRSDKVKYRMDLLVNLANSNNYEFTREEIADRFDDLEAYLQEIREVFEDEVDRQELKAERRRLAERRESGGPHEARRRPRPRRRGYRPRLQDD